MGLDMYLSAKTYVSRTDYARTASGTEWFPNDMFLTIAKLFQGENLIESDGFGGIEVSLPVAYWRKANHIHDWFVRNVQDDVDNCQEFSVSRSQLQELIDACTTVLDAVVAGVAWESIAKDYLPTQNGSFFGGTDYDEWYVTNTRYTRDRLTELLDALSDNDYYFSYRASW